jgi:hypothetical protein
MSCPATRAFAHLRNVRDELELAARVPGEIVSLTRQAVEAALDDIAVIGVCVRRLAEYDHG